MSGQDGVHLYFQQMITNYTAAQKKVANLVMCLSSKMTSVSPGQFLMLQFQVGNLTQIGDSISNVVSSLNGIAKNSISNMNR
ncbi:hypothetical protein EB008_02345 [bacterium]|jgi:hypothetical protein|nr:hypothetical protein [bacterium]